MGFSVVLLSALISSAVFAGNLPRFDFKVGNRVLRVQVLDDKLARFELTAKPVGDDFSAPSPMVTRDKFPGPTQFSKDGNRLETPRMAIEVDSRSLCFTLVDKARGGNLTHVCPQNLEQDLKGFTFSREATKNVFGLGQEFHDAGKTDGDWLGRVRHPGEVNGNRMVPFNGGSNGNTQIPVLYAMGETGARYGLFLDNTYRQQWDLTADPLKVDMWGDQVRFYLFVGDDLPSLRKTYMDLVGHPIVPPKKAFGLWISEYGYRNWGEVDGKLRTLREHHFPIDGFVLDLQWFGGITTNSDNTPMGKLTWDPKMFPSAKEKIAALRKDGLGIIPIEESYIGRNLSEHHELSDRGYLVKIASGESAYLTHHSWWGKGGYVDWSNPDASDFRHKDRRLALIQDGILGHWIDLGEPEIYANDARYFGDRTEADEHNLYNFHWIEGIWRGYQKYTPTLRPFMLSRSGTAGIQRYGAAMWSGDIGSNLDNLAAHLENQMHMSLSGIDYYGADIGGFKREALSGDLNEMYTQWFANGMLFDVPGRPHTENLCHCKETAPDRIGDLRSNLASLRQRYELAPYLYSLAHRAYREGEPVFPPAFYYFESDRNLRGRGDEKMIGPWLLAGAVAKHGRKDASVYLPVGRWTNYHSGQAVDSRGASKSVALYDSTGLFRLPLFARAGAIIPFMVVDDKTMNVLGQRTDGTWATDLNVRVYAAPKATSFTLYEDDGATTAYQKGEVRETLITQSGSDSSATVEVAPAKGNFAGAADKRNVIVELHARARAQSVTVGSDKLPELKDEKAWREAAQGWFARANGEVWVKTGVRSVTEATKVTAALK